MGNESPRALQFIFITRPGCLKMTMYLSGIQPSGKLHLGNYFGCIKPFLSSKYRDSQKNIFLIADMHCFTKPENISNITGNIIEVTRTLLAAGVNSEATNFVQQSKVIIDCI